MGSGHWVGWMIDPSGNSMTMWGGGMESPGEQEVKSGPTPATTVMQSGTLGAIRSSSSSMFNLTFFLSNYWLLPN